VTWTVTISNPTYVYELVPGTYGKQATDIPVTLWGGTVAFNGTTEAHLRIESNVAALYGLETNDATNALQLNSTVTIQKDGAYWFRGFVFKKPKFVNYPEGRYLQVACLGTEAVLLQALCADAAGNAIWTLESSKWPLTNMPLQATNAWGTFQGSTLWPDPDDANGLKCYTNGVSDTLDTTVNASATTFILSVTYKAFVPRGWVKIESEWIYFDGYDNSNVDGKYRLYNCVRGQLGTAAAGHTAPIAVQEKLGKEIAPAPYQLEWDDPVDDPDLGYVRRRRKSQYEIHAKVGCFVLPEPATGLYRASYSVYDEDKSFDAGSILISVNDIVKAICKSPVAYGGAGFADGDLSLSDETAALKVNRYDYDPQEKPLYAWDAIQDLLQMVGLEKEIAFFYRHSTGILRLEIVVNCASSFPVPHVEEIESEMSLEDVYSAIAVEYTDDQDLNRACPTYGYHQVAGAGGASPDHYYSCEKEGESWQIPSPTAHDAAGKGGIVRCTDGKTGSKLVAVFTHNPAARIEHSQYYFGTGAPPVNLNEITLIVGNYRVIDAAWQDYYNSDKTWIVPLEGCIDYNPATHSGTWVDLGCSLESKASPEGTFVEHTFNLFSVRRVNAVRVMWDYMAGGKTAHSHWAPLHDIEIIADQVKYVLVQLTDDPAKKGKSAYVYGPQSYEKLRGGVKATSGVGGSQRVMVYPIGAASHAAAVSLGRIALTTHLARWNQRRYGYRGIVPGNPELGITITVVEDTGVSYTGVIREVAILADVNGIDIQATILDSSASVIE
jgi:hypothetical protein